MNSSRCEKDIFKKCEAQKTEQKNCLIISTMTSNSTEEQDTQTWKNQRPMIQGSRSCHGSAKIDDHRVIIVGGRDADDNVLSSGFIYDARTQQSTPLCNDMPTALYCCYAVANGAYMYVIGGWDANHHSVNTVYRLSVVTEEWTMMAPMGTPRHSMAIILKDKYVYLFGGCIEDGANLSSAKRYSIDNNAWEELPDNPKGGRNGHCAVSSRGSEIYIVGGAYISRSSSVDVFDTSSLTWKTPTYLRHLPEVRIDAAALLLKKKYLVVIGGAADEGWRATYRYCLIYDIWCNRWSSTPASMDMISERVYHTAAVLDGKIVVAGGEDQDDNKLASVECIDADALLEYAPLHFPLPRLLFNRILQIGKFEMERVRCADFDKLIAKKRRMN